MKAYQNCGEWRLASLFFYRSVGLNSNATIPTDTDNLPDSDGYHYYIRGKHVIYLILRRASSDRLLASKQACAMLTTHGSWHSLSLEITQHAKPFTVAARNNQIN